MPDVVLGDSGFSAEPCCEAESGNNSPVLWGAGTAELGGGSPAVMEGTR